MNIYQSKNVNGKFENTEKTSIAMNSKYGKCRPFISLKRDYLIFAKIGNELTLMISYNDEKGGWINTKKLNTEIKNKGQVNPYVTSDNNFFFTTGGYLKKNWKVKWVNIESEIK
jgi:hypothetical protein